MPPASFFFPPPAWSRGGPGRKTQALVSDFGDKAITLIRDGKIAPDDRQRQFRTLVDRYFDMPAIAGFVLARFWKGVDEGERVEFISALEGQIVEAYLGRFKGYAGETFAVKPGRRQKDSTMVPSSIVHADGSPPMSVDWTVQDSPKGLRIRDVSVSGVSMALTYRDEFSAVMQRNNGKIGPLITALRAVADAQRGE